MKKHKNNGIEDILNDNQDTKKRNSKKDKKKQKKKKIVKRFLLLLFIIIIALGIWLGISMHSWQSIAKEMIKNRPSTVLDSDGNIIAELGSEKIHKNITFSEIPDNLKNAYISIEDQRFYKHHGVDMKRTLAAIGSYVIHFGSSSFGGSTITQQLVKNITGDSSDSISRKISEWIKAFELEICTSKEEILGTYLNIIYVGPNIYGVEMGSKYYFDKSVSNLSLAECAFLAGLNHSPNSYNPFVGKNNSEKIVSRTKTVLYKMLELGYITQEDYDEAIAEVEQGLKFTKGEAKSESNSIYSYHTDAVISELISTLSKKKHISESFATNYLNMSDLTIFSTQNSTIQDNIEKEFLNGKFILKSSKSDDITSQAAMIIVNQYNGQVVGCVGGLGEKTTSRGFNRATQAIRQTGSASKPLAVLAPALNKKIITATTIYNDKEDNFKNVDGTTYSPTDYNQCLGEITVRRAVESSQNIPFVRIMEQITPKYSIDFLKKMGITTLTEKDNNLSLALGGLDKGISPLEMAGAYSTIANNGVYIQPTFYTKVVSSSGKTILEPKQKTKKVFSEDIAYILKELLKQPVIGNAGTATYCSIPGMDVAAKTGTTNDNYDRWLCGFTNYYTGVTWYGYDLSEAINYDGKNPAAIIWADVMKNVHKKLSNSAFTSTKNVRSASICADTGKTSTSSCPNTYTEYFLKGTVPNQCSKHKGYSKANNSNTKKTNNQKQDYTEKNYDDNKKNTTKNENNANSSNNTKNNKSDNNNKTNTINNNNNNSNKKSNTINNSSSNKSNTNSTLNKKTNSKDKSNNTKNTSNNE